MRWHFGAISIVYVLSIYAMVTTLFPLLYLYSLTEPVFVYACACEELTTQELCIFIWVGDFFSISERYD